jgi:hypothetical protein
MVLFLLLSVIAAIDPAIPHQQLARLMDARVNPAHDQRFV